MRLSNPIGVLLINLGTPDAPNKRAVGKYLRQFLNDPRVIELPTWLRYILVNGLIVPRRAKQSAHAYASIWQANGSPLLINSLQLCQRLQESLGNDFCVELGMRYGNPSILQGITRLMEKNIARLVVVPLFPHYASAVNGSALENVMRLLCKQKVIIPLTLISEFHTHTAYIDAQAATIAPHLASDHEFLLFSFHGLPQRQLINPGVNCYQTKCLNSAASLAQNLQLKDGQWGVSFQSRLGRLAWIKPYTDQFLIDLRARGIKNILIACPSFVADCLETLEEIGIRARAQWLELGGDKLHLIPCMNDDVRWVCALETIIHDNLACR